LKENREEDKRRRKEEEEKKATITEFSEAAENLYRTKFRRG
jgi:hypothetical protein